MIDALKEEEIVIKVGGRFKLSTLIQKRLAAMDISGWPVSQQVDYHIVRAEMNGLDFEHRVRRPWSRDPDFYRVSGAGPRMYGFSGLRNPRLPLQGDDIAKFKMLFNIWSTEN